MATHNQKILAGALSVVIVAAAFFAVAAVIVTVATQSVISTGTINAYGLQVCADAGCQNNLTSISWGNLDPGQANSFSFYVKNTGTASETLSLGTSNWSPAGAASYLTISWNLQGTQLTPGQVATATMSITVSPSITGINSFSNTLTITATSS